MNLYAYQVTCCILDILEVTDGKKSSLGSDLDDDKKLIHQG
jgi:hypothetical protein